jgi:helicase SWR1
MSDSSMPPPPLPNKNGRGSRRATMHESPLDLPDPDGAAEDAFGAHERKRPRHSLPKIIIKKPRGSVLPEIVDEPSPLESPRIPSPEPLITSTSTNRLPSLSHLPFPLPPPRPRHRFSHGKIWYTDPPQLPPPPKHDGHLSPIMESYIHLEDSGTAADIRLLEVRAAKEAYYRNRVNYLQQQGRLLRLLDEHHQQQAYDADPKSARKPLGPPPRLADHQDSLMTHMVQVRKAILEEAKLKPVICKRVARMVQVYWEMEEGKEERARLVEERERKRKGKEVMKALRKRWALAVKVSL